MWLHTLVFSCLEILGVCIGLALNICLHDPVHDSTLYENRSKTYFIGVYITMRISPTFTFTLM